MSLGGQFLMSLDNHLAASHFPVVLRAREGARSVGLKNACRSGPARHFCGARVLDASGLGSRGASVGEVWPAPHPWWISSVSSSPSTGVGLPLTESPGRCRVHERGRAGSLMEANTTACCVERVLKGGRERCAASGAGRLFCRAWRASGSAQRSTLAWLQAKHYEWDLGAAASRATAAPDRVRGLKGR